jgi:branched-chain amino acid transport system ATP-binding protein
MLKVNNVTIRFGGVTAIDNLSFNIKAKEIFGLIGPNGAGKTTMFNIITANYKANEGEVLLRDEPLKDYKPNQIVKKGIARTFQNIRLFNSMSVLENVLIGFHNRTKYNLAEAFLRFPRFFQQEKEIHSEAMDILASLGIEKFSDYPATALSYGNQRKVEIARALATNPELLLLDEPAAGMNPNETDDLSEIIFKIKDDLDLTILLIEHDMKFVNRMCDRVLVLDYGKKIFEGTPAEAIVDENVVTAYLGDFKHA